MNPPLQRHQLWHLTLAGWQALTAALPREDTDLHGLLAHWAAADLPLVVTRQAPDPAAPDRLAFGLPAPCAWGRRRVALRVAPAMLDRPGTFPTLTQVAPLLASAAAAAAAADALIALIALDAELRAAGVIARSHGSHGWEALCGLPCRQSGSDLDLLLPVHDAAQADAVVRRLMTADARHAPPPAGPAASTDGRPGSPALPRLDGELLIPDGGGIAWRDWAACRAPGPSARDDRVLVKHLHGPRLVPIDQVFGLNVAAAA